MPGGHPIYANDIFSDDKIAKAEGQLQAISKRIEDVVKIAGNLKGGLFSASPSSSSGQKQIATTSKEVNKLVREYENLKFAQSEAGKSLARLRQAKIQANFINKAEAKQAQAAKNSYAALSAEMSQLKVAVKQYTEAQMKNNPAARGMVSRIKDIDTQLKRMDATMGVHTRYVGNYKSALGKVGASLRNLAAGYLGVIGAQRLFTSIFQNTKQLDALDFAQRKVITSSQELADTHAFLNDITERYGTSLIAATKSYTQFRAATKAANLTAQETRDIFESFAKSSSVLGLNTEETRGVFKALEQMMSKGKISSEELRQQLGERIPVAIQAMAKAVGVTTGELQKMLEQGQVLSKDVMPAFAREVENALGIQSVKKVNTLAAAQQRFGNAWVELIRELKASSAFTDLFDTMAKGVNFIKENIEAILALGKVVTGLTVAYLGLKTAQLAGSKVMALMAPLFNAATVRTAGYVTATRSAALAQTGLNTAMRLNPIGLLTTAFLVLIPLVGLLGQNLEKVKTVQEQVNDEIERELKHTNELFRVAREYNESSKTRKKAIEDLQALYPGYLDNIESEKNQKDKLLKVQEKINDELREETSLRVVQARIAKNLTKEREISDKLESGKEGQLRIDRFGNPVKISSDLTERRKAELEEELRLLEEQTTGYIDHFQRLSGKKQDAERDAAEQDKKAAEEAFLKAKQRQFDLREIEIRAIEDINERKLAELELAHEKERFQYRDDHEALVKLRRAQLQELRELADTIFKSSPEQIQSPFLAPLPTIGTPGSLASETDDTKEFDKKLRLGNEEIDFEQKKAQLILELSKSTEEEKYLTALEFTKKRIELELNLLKAEGKITSERAAILRGFLANMEVEIGRVQESIKQNQPKGKDGNPQNIWELAFPEMDKEKREAIKTGVEFAIGQSLEMFNVQQQIAEQQLQFANQRISSAERALQAEIENRNAGRAHKIETAQKELDAAKKQQEEALEQRRKAQQAQLLIDSATQASSLVTATANIWKDVGFPLAIPAIGIMWGSFIAGKIRAAQLTKKQFAKGTDGVEMIGGGSHASGNDTYIGQVGAGGSQPGYAERGEAMAVFSKKRTRQYGKPFLDMVANSINQGTFEDLFAFKGEHYSDTINNANVDTSSLERGINTLVRQGQEKHYRDSKGRLVTKYKNLTVYHA